MKRLLAIALLTSAGSPALAACPDSMMRDPTFVTLAVDENTPRPASVEDFRFVDDTTTFAQLTAKVGTPDAVKGSRTYLYCLPDGVVIYVSTNDGDIKYVRAGSKLIYKRK